MVSILLVSTSLVSSFLERASFYSPYNDYPINFKDANFSDANLRDIHLYHADLGGANLSGVNLRNATLDYVNLSGANLSDANLSGANLESFNLSGANLSGANLKKVQALFANFEGVTLTGACIEDWNINSKTNFQNVNCECIYLQSISFKEENNWIYRDRRPHDSNKNFAPGEFTKLFQKALETVDLIFSDGIDWQAFLTSFQKLQVECGSKELAIQAIEKKPGDAFVVRVEVPPDTNKAEIEKFFKRKYRLALKAKEEEYKKLLQAKDKDIVYFRQQNTKFIGHN